MALFKCYDQEVLGLRVYQVNRGNENAGVRETIVVSYDREKIAAFCHKWKIVEFSLFGSALRDDSGPVSDVDVLVTFSPDAPWSLWDFCEMETELSELLGRQADVVEKAALRNPFVRHRVLTERRVIYAA
ncbi:MAG: nucleotidyltransferase family protein [Planctomycetota bacterium]